MKISKLQVSRLVDPATELLDQYVKDSLDETIDRRVTVSEVDMIEVDLAEVKPIMERNNLPTSC